MGQGINATNAVLYHNQKSQISIVRGSVVDMYVDAIVNAANFGLLGGGFITGSTRLD